MATWLSPPRIVHQDGKLSDDRPTLCAMCGDALHMSKGEVTLLQYYASCQTGYTPSLQSIANITGLSRRMVQYCRQMLVKHGCIALTPFCVYVNWARIRLFSTLDPSLTSKHASIDPAPQKSSEPQKYIEAVPLTEAISLFASMTDEDYEKWRSGYRQHQTRKSSTFTSENKFKDLEDELEDLSRKIAL